MARWVKCLYPKHEVLSLIPTVKIKKFRCTLVIPTLRQRQADSWGLLDRQPSLIGELQVR